VGRSVFHSGSVFNLPPHTHTHKKNKELLQSLLLANKPRKNVSSTTLPKSESWQSLTISPLSIGFFVSGSFACLLFLLKHAFSSVSPPPTPHDGGLILEEFILLSVIALWSTRVQSQPHSPPTSGVVWVARGHTNARNQAKAGCREKQIGDLDALSNHRASASLRHPALLQMMDQPGVSAENTGTKFSRKIMFFC
jgi:hypothetical protein